MKVLLDTTPLLTGHAIRGVGSYTRFLAQALEQVPDLELQRTDLGVSAEFKPDLVHYPFFDLFFKTLPWRQKTPTVVTVHDVIPLKFPKHYQPGKKGKLRFWQQKAALKKVKAVITDSQASRQDIIDYLGIEPSKVHVVYLAANPILKATTATQIKQVLHQFKLPIKYLLYVGDINYNKNLPQLIKSLKYVDESLHLVCVGKEFYEHDIPEWRAVANQLILSDVGERVHFVTEVAAEDTLSLSAIYSGAVCYVQPSLAEGFGLPVLEAMQCQTPVVSTQNSSLIEIGDAHVVGVGERAEEIAKGINEVLSWSAALRGRKINQAFYWSQTFSWKKTAQQTVAVYQQVLAEK